MSSSNHTYALPDEAATLALGAALAAVLRPGLTIYLHGELGAGKTTLTRGLLRALGHTGPVRSPTYALVELYVISGYILYHFDFYRFNQPEEWLEAGLDEHFNQDTVCLVEWPEKAGDLLPPADMDAVIEVAGLENGPADGAIDKQARRITLNAHSERGTSCLNDLRFPRPTQAP
ncbi:MAG TPA: tRNA (adenosine(37)-N6)-threonylcarbamoyltransferase complex ATPase subunit type 1 TsaE [Burkholderiales bacterium]|jgi:tRNA threonylcarbamoyladenosine biosynthesis protein TsaE|nr:tRNA (adenosine(37)-N6)-threonylcarbamoyltransferase complex ATPase subunit type 1 TsaE [Burkholderiales bacterium]